MALGVWNDTARRDRPPRGRQSGHLPTSLQVPSEIDTSACRPPPILGHVATRSGLRRAIQALVAMALILLSVNLTAEGGDMRTDSHPEKLNKEQTLVKRKTPPPPSYFSPTLLDPSDDEAPDRESIRGFDEESE